jgi:hypothetical protein
MSDTKRRSGWVIVCESVALVGALSGVGWAIWDHAQKKAEPDAMHVRGKGNVSGQVGGNGNVVGQMGNGNVVGSTQNIGGSGNVVNNGGTINVGHTIPQSEKEAARQRMHDSGIEYSEDRYYEALQHHEVDVIRLFTHAGMTISQGDFPPFTTSFFDEDVAKAMLEIDQSPGCPTDAGMGDIYGTLKGAPLAFARQACGTPRVRARLQETIAQAREQLRMVEADDRTNQERRTKDIASCAATMQRTFGARVSAATAQEQCTMRVMPVESAAPRAQARLTVLEESLAALGGPS